MKGAQRTAFGVLIAICVCHSINDMLQSLLAAVYPTLKIEFSLSFAQIGLVTLAYQLTASLLQPVVGLVADRRPMPFSLPGGTLFTFAGLLVLCTARSYALLLIGACILGIGSSVFHPESSRVARMASGGRHGLAQSLFQVGGNVGSALGPVGAAIVVVRWGHRGLGAFSVLALISACILTGVGVWYKRHGLARLAVVHEMPRIPSSAGSLLEGRAVDQVKAPVKRSMIILLALIFSKFIYLASFTSYYTFYLMHRFGVPVRNAQMHLFVFLAAAAAGTLAGGPLGDRFGRKHVIWASVLGVLPFTLALPYANLFWTGALTVVIGLILASAFPAIVVYGQEVIPGRVGMVSGLFFGLSFGAAGSGAALLGALADATNIEFVYRLCAFLPALGILAALLPDLRGHEASEIGDRLVPTDSPTSGPLWSDPDTGS
jgi:FSR family fosmidomycin resistance protein-like MFS transporter